MLVLVLYLLIKKMMLSGAIGYEGLKLMRKLLPQIPLVAIGGIQTQHIKDIMKTNIDGVSIISTISYAKNIEKTVRGNE